MKIHTDALSSLDLYRATDAAGMHGVHIDGLTRHGSWSRDHAYNVTLRGNSTRRPNPGAGGRSYYDDNEYAATWDEWGMFIEALFQADPNAIIGQYRSHALFRAATRNRFDWLTARDACPDHRWEYQIGFQTCKRCNAEQDHMALYRTVQNVDA
jgi:hypothetical protein